MEGKKQRIQELKKELEKRIERKIARLRNFNELTSKFEEWEGVCSKYGREYITHLINNNNLIHFFPNWVKDYLEERTCTGGFSIYTDAIRNQREDPLL